jgi:hypothetical protein
MIGPAIHSQAAMGRETAEKQPVQCRPMRRLLILMALIAATGCSSDGPKMSGFGFGSTRIVQVGQIVELRLPLGQDGSRTWRVTSYDSLYLAIAGPPTVAVDGNGKEQLVLVARAKLPGKTEVQVTEMVSRSAGRAPRIETFKVEIID